MQIFIIIPTHKEVRFVVQKSESLCRHTELHICKRVLTAVKSVHTIELKVAVCLHRGEFVKNYKKRLFRKLGTSLPKFTA
jgi:hypothetical protein